MRTMIAGKAQPALTTADRLTRLARLEQTGQISLFATRTIDKLFAHEIAEACAQFSQLQTDLAEFEARYAMKSTDFYQRYQSGQTDDRLDFVEWVSLIQMTINLQKRLEVLAGEKPQ